MRQPAQRPGILRPPMPVDHYENFPVASFLLPAHLREPVEAIYAFARSADDIADEGDAPPIFRLARLNDYRRALHAIEQGKPFDDPTLAPIFATAFATQNSHTTLLVGLASATGAGISISTSAGSLTTAGATTGIAGITTQGILVSGSTGNFNFGNVTVTGGTDGVSLQNNSAGTRTFGTLNVSGGYFTEIRNFLILLLPGRRRNPGKGGSFFM